MVRVIAISFICAISAQCYGQVNAVESRTLSRGPGPSYSDRQSAVDWERSKKLSLTPAKQAPANPPFPNPFDDPANLRPGQSVDASCWATKVLQVLDSSSMLITIGDSTYMLEGYPTDDIADRDSIRLLDRVETTGMHEYTTTLGTKSKIRKLRMIPDAATPRATVKPKPFENPVKGNGVYSVIDSLIAEHKDNESTRERLQLIKSRVEQLMHENTMLQESIDRNKTAKGFIEHKGAMFKSNGIGTFASDVYCPKCEKLMIAISPTAPFACPICKKRAGFSPLKLPSVLDDIRDAK